jgi:hypothetical protein
VKNIREISAIKTDNNGRDNGGKFLPGNPGKPKGSSKNKLRDEIRFFLKDNWQNLPTWIDKLKPKEKIEVYLALMPYAVSRLQSVSMTDSEGEDIPRIETYVDYTKLSPAALKEILKNTKQITNE